MTPREETVVFQKRKYRTCVTYDAVLDVQLAYRDKELPAELKLSVALHRFLRSPWRVRKMALAEKVELLNAIFSQQIEIPQKGANDNATRILDFHLDEEYIYASFLQAYGMDLRREAGRLHWKDYISLFQGLPDDTQIKEVMRIRAMELPAPTKNNQKQIQQLIKLKSYYALPVVGGGGQSGLNRLFDMLASQAVRK